MLEEPVYSKYGISKDSISISNSTKSIVSLTAKIFVLSFEVCVLQKIVSSVLSSLFFEMLAYEALIAKSNNKKENNLLFFKVTKKNYKNKIREIFFDKC